jgi:flagellar biosynthesis protein FliP
MRRFTTYTLLITGILCLLGNSSFAQIPVPNISIGMEETSDPAKLSTALQIVFLLTILSLAPAILILTTCFTRIIVVFSFLRNALSTQQLPPNQILIGLALFITFVIMAPTWHEMNRTAIQPYVRGEIQAQRVTELINGEEVERIIPSYEVAFTRALLPLREFMFKQTGESEMALFIILAKMPRPKSRDDVPTHLLVPAFVISELKKAFQIGFIIFIPFIIIDMVVASVLMSMGMLMLPPMMISLPFKLLLFVLVDGWYLLVESLATPFL